MNLNNIRDKLIRLEDTICLHLFERSQYKLNGILYEDEGIKIPDFNGSFLNYALQRTEELYASLGCYENPEEHPFLITPSKALIPKENNDHVDFNPTVNLNNVILAEYITLLSNLCQNGNNQGHHCATVISDINILQALSKRIHIGEQVAEVKYREDPSEYNRLININDEAGILNKLRVLRVEKSVLARVRQKSKRYSLPPELITTFYKEKIMPLTMKVEVEYFMNKKSEK